MVVWNSSVTVRTLRKVFGYTHNMVFEYRHGGEVPLQALSRTDVVELVISINSTEQGPMTIEVCASVMAPLFRGDGLRFCSHTLTEREVATLIRSIPLKEYNPEDDEGD